ncbi:MAG: MATE family efflux transporter, partial [Alistipes sp.]|nr:MATE family efflux transporter [Alistipes sp.]
LFLVPGMLFLQRLFDTATPWSVRCGVWCAMPLSDLLAATVTFFMLTAQLRKFRGMMTARTLNDSHDGE